jgi:ribosomal protein L37E
MNMPDFGSVPRCAACGYGTNKFDVVFHFAVCCTDQGRAMDVASHGAVPQPHMHRTCPQCGFTWLEKTFAEVFSTSTS